MVGTYNRGICNFQSSEIISLSLISSQMKSNNVICGIKKCQSVKQTHFHIAMFFETPPYLIYNSNYNLQSNLFPKYTPFLNIYMINSTPNTMFTG